MSRVAAVTGGHGAIGGAIADALAAAGYEVARIDRRGDFACDLAEEDQARGAARGFGRVILIVSDTVRSPPAADLLPSSRPLTPVCPCPPAGRSRPLHQLDQVALGIGQERHPDAWLR